MPKIVSTAPFEYNLTEGVFVATGTWFDLPALVIVADSDGRAGDRHPGERPFQ